MENGHWWEAYKNRWTVDAGRNVIIGQCEPEEEKATRGFMDKQAARSHACENMVPFSRLQAQWETEEGGQAAGHILLF